MKYYSYKPSNSADLKRVLRMLQLLGVLWCDGSIATSFKGHAIAAVDMNLDFSCDDKTISFSMSDTREEWLNNIPDELHEVHTFKEFIKNVRAEL